MKQLLFACGLGALAASLPAHSQSTVDTVVVPAQKGTPALTLWPGDIQEYIGDYQLSNGMTLLITKQGNKMFGQIGSLPRHELVATGQRKFAAPDGKLSVQIKYTWDGLITGNVAYVDERRSSSTQPVVLQFASR